MPTLTRPFWIGYLMLIGVLWASWFLLVALEIGAGVHGYQRTLFVASLVAGFFGLVAIAKRTCGPIRGTKSMIALGIAVIVLYAIAVLIGIVAGVNLKLALGGSL